MACVPEYNMCDYAWNWKLCYCHMIVLHSAHPTSETHLCNNSQTNGPWIKSLQLMCPNTLACLYIDSPQTHSATNRSPITALLFTTLSFWHRPPFSPSVFLTSFLNTFLFLPSFLPTALFIRKKIEMQEHIVAVGRFCLHTHFWRGQLCC